MKIVQKIMELQKDTDVRAFLKYAMLHPSVLKMTPVSQKKPPYLKENISDGRTGKQSCMIKKLLLPADKERELSNDIFETKEWTIHLAGMDVRIEIDHINWMKDYDDQEDTFALHRFLWLYRQVTENLTLDLREKYHTGIKKIIYSWIDQVEKGNKEDKKNGIWHTYTTAERIVCWTVLLGITCEKGFTDRKITESVKRQLKYIFQHLEYYGEQYTGNHLTNDGRGLYIAGMMLGLEKYAQTGRVILLQEFQRVVTDTCMLREGSVHYQFLYTKWYTDVLWIAKSCGDFAFADKISGLLENLLDGCRRFLYKNTQGQWEIPLFGDISPDYRPQWLTGVPWAACFVLGQPVYQDIPEGKGYHTLFLGTGKEAVQAERADQTEGNAVFSDWGFMNSGHFKVYSHVNHSLYPNNAAGHFHHDSGSLVLLYDGEPLLTDCGRKNYLPESVSKGQRNCAGHNLLIVDGKNPEIDMRRFYGKQFLAYYLAKAPAVLSDRLKIRMELCYGKRGDGVTIYRRNIHAEEDGIAIQDLLKGNGRHTIELRFHIPAKYKVTLLDRLLDSGAMLTGRNGTFRIHFTDQPDELKLSAGHISEEYGKTKRCSVLLYRKKVLVPYELKTVIQKVRGE